jgi:hypothetical protein
MITEARRHAGAKPSKGSKNGGSKGKYFVPQIPSLKFQGRTDIHYSNYLLIRR